MIPILQTWSILKSQNTIILPSFPLEDSQCLWMKLKNMSYRSLSLAKTSCRKEFSANLPSLTPNHSLRETHPFSLSKAMTSKIFWGIPTILCLPNMKTDGIAAWATAQQSEPIVRFLLRRIKLFPPKCTTLYLLWPVSNSLT